MTKLWGDNFYNPETRKFTTEPSDGNGGQLPRCFVSLIMKPIIVLIRNIMEGQLDLVWKMLEQLGVELAHEQRERRKKDLMKIVCQKWINAAEALLEMIIMKLPSPKKAQKYRAAYLYEGPIDDPCGQAIASCNK